MLCNFQCLHIWAKERDVRSAARMRSRDAHQSVITTSHVITHRTLSCIRPKNEDGRRGREYKRVSTM